MKKEDLYRYREIKRELVQLKERLNEAELTYSEIKAVKLSGMPRNGRFADIIGDNVARIDELREFYFSKISQLTKLQIDIERAIEILEPEERSLIRKRYFDGLKWEDICENMCYSWKTAHRIHKKAVEKLKVDIE